MSLLDVGKSLHYLLQWKRRWKTCCFLILTSSLSTHKTAWWLVRSDLAHARRGGEDLSILAAWCSDRMNVWNLGILAARCSDRMISFVTWLELKTYSKVMSISNSYKLNNLVSLQGLPCSVRVCCGLMRIWPISPDLSLCQHYAGWTHLKLGLFEASELLLTVLWCRRPSYISNKLPHHIARCKWMWE